ncbi:GDSL esterase/lipase apg-like, partial [Trifolium medium]|nr:GDSL esterase/lipase apg-like [Trifolium medium]
ETLGFTTFPPAYLSPQASGKNLLIGANFASAASGFDEKAATLNHAITLPQQLSYFKEYQGKLAQVAGSKKAASIIKDSLYLLSAGSSDFLQNYYVNPWVNKLVTVDQYSAYLLESFNSFVKFSDKWARRSTKVKPHVVQLKDNLVKWLVVFKHKFYSINHKLD